MGPGSRPGRRLNMRSHSRGAMRPEFCISFALFNKEGAGKTGCAPHPRSRAQNCASNTRTSIQVWRRHPAFPAQWLYGLYVIVLVTGFLATIVIGSFRLRQLDASTGASDPNDFAVRFCHARQSQPSRPPLPVPRLRRWPTPLWWDRMAGVLEVICPTAEAEYFSREDWTTQITLNRLGKFLATRPLVYAFAHPFSPSHLTLTQ